MLKLSSAGRGLMFWSAALVGVALMTTPARAAFHLWNLTELYTNSSGTLQFIELNEVFGGQQFVGGQQVQVSNIGGSITHTFTLPSNLPGDTANHFLLLGTAGIQAAGGPAPDYIIPSGFLFSAGGTINFFGANPGPYSALPTDGLFSRTWGGGNAVNSPRNFAGQQGQVVPAPGTTVLVVCGGAYLLRRRRAS